jgi:hypothetical protein
MKAVQRVMRPKQVVIVAKKRRGPMKRRRIVEGSWKMMLLRVNIQMETEYRFPVKSRSLSIDVTEAEEMMPLSSKLRLQSRPAIVQRRRSTLSLSLRSARMVDPSSISLLF